MYAKTKLSSRKRCSCISVRQNTHHYIASLLAPLLPSSTSPMGNYRHSRGLYTRVAYTCEYTCRVPYRTYHSPAAAGIALRDVFVQSLCECHSVPWTSPRHPSNSKHTTALSPNEYLWGKSSRSHYPTQTRTS